MIRVRARQEPALPLDSSRTVSLDRLIHCVLAVQALIFLAQELLTIRIMGIPESHISLVVGSITRWSTRCWRWPDAPDFVRPPPGDCLVCASVGLGDRGHGLAVVLSRRLRSGRWPELIASRFMPLFLLVVMLLPRIKRVFAKACESSRRSRQPPSETGRRRGPDVPIGGQVISTGAVLFLIVVCSNLWWTWRIGAIA